MIHAAEVPSDPGGFYAVCATILVGTVIAGVLEIRGITRSLDRRVPWVARLSLVAVSAQVLAGAITLASIPAAMTGPPGWLTEPEHISAVISLTITVAITAPVLTATLNAIFLDRSDPALVEAMVTGRIAEPRRSFVLFLILVLAVARVVRRR